MPLKNVPRRIKRGKASSQDIQEIKQKQPILLSAKQTKVLPKRVSPGHRTNNLRREEHRPGQKGSASLSYQSRSDTTDGYWSPITSTKRASPVNRNDILHSRNSKSSITVHGDVRPSCSPVVNQDSTSFIESSPVCMSPRCMSNTFEHVSLDSSAVKGSPNTSFAEIRTGTSESRVSAGMESYTRGFVGYCKKIKDRKNDDTETEDVTELNMTEKPSTYIAVDYRTGASSRQSSAIYSSDISSRNNSSLIRTDKSNRNDFEDNETESQSRKHSALYRTNTSSSLNRTDSFSRVISAVNSINTTSKSNYTVQITDTPSRRNSALNLTDIQSRNNSALYRADTSSPVYRTDTSSRSNSEVRVTGTPSTNNQDTKYTIDNEIIQGIRIESPSTGDGKAKMFESANSEIKDREREKTKDEAYICPSSPFLGDSPRTYRTGMSSRSSPLMCGSGKFRKKNDIETLELHFDKTDYSNLSTQRSSNIFHITVSTCSKSNAQQEKKISPRPIEVQLPKTYITRSGSLLLYSDSKVMKDKQGQRSKNRGNDKNIRVQGRKMSPRTLAPKAYPYWGKHVNTKKPSPAADKRNTGCTQKDQREYIGIGSQGSYHSNHKPYSWNYTALPVKLIDADEEKDIKTVNNLSAAVLAYRSKPPTTEDKYLTIMKQTRDGKTRTEKLAETAGQLERLSTWTNEWMKSQSSVTFNKNTKAHTGQNNSEGEMENDLIARLRNSLKQSVCCQAQANTPLVGAKQKKRLNISMSHLYQREFKKSFSNASNVLTSTPRSLLSKYN